MPEKKNHFGYKTRQWRGTLAIYKEDKQNDSFVPELTTQAAHVQGFGTMRVRDWPAMSVTLRHVS